MCIMVIIQYPGYNTENIYIARGCYPSHCLELAAVRLLISTSSPSSQSLCWVNLRRRSRLIRSYLALGIRWRRRRRPRHTCNTRLQLAASAAVSVAVSYPRHPQRPSTGSVIRRRRRWPHLICTRRIAHLNHSLVWYPSILTHIRCPNFGLFYCWGCELMIDWQSDFPLLCVDPRPKEDCLILIFLLMEIWNLFARRCKLRYFQVMCLF
jgi:hypothetical protein